MFRPLEGLLGLYLPPPTGPGIMITTNRPLHLQRFTAAHELGHYILDHSNSSFDERIGFVSRGDYNQDVLQEVAADAFAAEFMLPRWLLVSHLRRREWTPAQLRKPEIVYQLSLRVAMSYEATCRSLLGHEMINQNDLNKLLSTTPKLSKQNVLGDLSIDSWHNDVWNITEKDSGSQFIGNPDDVIVATLSENVSSGYTWKMQANNNQDPIILRDTREGSSNSGLGAKVKRKIIITKLETGILEFVESRIWSKDQHINSIELELLMNGREMLPWVPSSRAA